MNKNIQQAIAEINESIDIHEDLIKEHADAFGYDSPIVYMEMGAISGLREAIRQIMIYCKEEKL